MQIPGKVFVVTGGGDGIGREVVLELVRRGASVAAVDRRPEALKETARLVAPVPIATFTVDITDRAAVESLPQQVRAEFGHIDGVFNVAGIIQPFVSISDLSIEQMERVMDVNFWGTVFMVRAFLPGLLERPEACVINVSSMGALVPFPGQGAYGASKAAVKLLTECLHAELQGTSVAVSEVFPGAVGTHISDNSGVTTPGAVDASSAKMTPAPAAARQIVDAAAHGKFRVLIGSDARTLDRLSRIAPTRAITIVADRMKKAFGLAS